jgi:hypothetical protein
LKPLSAGCRAAGNVLSVRADFRASQEIENEQSKVTRFE